MILKNYMKLGSVKELLIKDQFQFLKEMIKASLINFPFQNISSIGAFLPMERRTPVFRDILQGCMRGEGGLCGHLNHHMKLQLESLGYQTQTVSGCFVRNGVPNSHCLVTVKIPHYADKSASSTPLHLRRDKNYLIDVGSGVPLHEPIDLDALPFIRTAGGLQYRFERVNDTTITRVHESGDALLGAKPADFKSPQDCSIDLSPRTPADFHPIVHAVYSNPQKYYLHRNLYCLRYLDITEDDFEIICIFGKDLMFITKETRHVQSFENYESLKPVLFKYFPMIDSGNIERCVYHFSLDFEESLKMTSKKAATAQ